MDFRLHSRHLLKLLDFNSREIEQLLNLSRQLKAAKKAGEEPRFLQNKNIALIFEKASTRTRCAFEVASFDQGANVTCISSGSQMGSKESVKTQPESSVVCMMASSFADIPNSTWKSWQNFPAFPYGTV